MLPQPISSPASKMTKLQLLNAYLTERLAALVKEVLDVVEDTVAEYREETARTRRENESLRRQLRDILLLEAETEWLSKGCYRERTPCSELRCKINLFKTFKRVLATNPT